MSVRTAAVHWEFTLNNPTVTSNEELEALKEHSAYFVWQGEKSSTGTIHLQGYIKFSAKQRLSAVTRLLSHAHFTKVTRTPELARAYCMRESKRCPQEEWVAYWRGLGFDVPDDLPCLMEHGTWTASGNAKARREAAIEMVVSGRPMHEIADEHPDVYVACHRGLLALKYAKQCAAALEERALEVLIFYGPAGAGKSHTAMEYEDVFVVDPPGKNQPLWFDGYDGQKTIVLDDFRPDWCTHAYLLRLCDKYRMKVPVKGGFAPALWTRVIITSTIHWAAWYPEQEAESMQLARRITEVREFEPRPVSVPSRRPAVPSRPVPHPSHPSSIQPFTNPFNQ